IVEKKLADVVKAKEQLFRNLLVHKNIKEIRGKGLMLAIQLDTFENVQKVIDLCLKNGVVSDWFLFCDNAIRLSPPLNISEEDIRKACEILLEGIELI